MIFVGNTNPVGSVVDAVLTEAQFQAQNGTGWVLADGRTVTGSAYATITGNSTIPDFRGITRRAKNNGRNDGTEDETGDHTLGSYQTSHVQGHNHAWYYDDGNNGVPAKTYSLTNTAVNYNSAQGAITSSAITTGNGTAIALYTSGVANQTITNVTNPGASQSIPSSNYLQTACAAIIVNTFIRIN